MYGNCVKKKNIRRTVVKVEHLSRIMQNLVLSKNFTKANNRGGFPMPSRHVTIVQGVVLVTMTAMAMVMKGCSSAKIVTKPECLVVGP